MHEDNTELQAFPLLRDSGKMPGQESSILKALRKLKFQDNKQDRLARVSVCRRQKLQEPSRVNRDKIMRRESIEWAQESFSRYYPSRPTPSKFSSELVTEALADFGVKAGTRPEKLVVKEYFAQKEGIDMHFGEFCKIVEEVRAKLRIARSPCVFQAWLVIDRGSGGLEPLQLPRLLKDLNVGKGFGPKIGSENPVTFRPVGELISELYKDDRGLVSFQEAEFLVQQAREMELARRRKYERDLHEKYGLKKDTFSEFRSQLIEFHEAFTEMCKDSDGVGDRDLIELLLDVGVLSAETTLPERKQMERTVANYMRQTLGSRVRFPGFLMTIRFIRGLAMAKRTSEVTRVFDQYDNDKSDALDLKEIYKLLVDIHLAPRTSQEQESIAELLEECDADGSGVLDFSEAVYLAQRIDEMRDQARRALENKKAGELKFPPEETRQLRSAFEMLDNDSSRTLGITEMEHAVQLMGWRVTPNKLRKLLNEVDEDESGQVEFIEFLTLMRRIDDELRTTPGEPTLNENGKLRATSGEPTHINETGKIDEGLSSAPVVSVLPDEFKVDMSLQTTARRRRAAGPGSSSTITNKSGKSVSHAST